MEHRHRFRKLLGRRGHKEKQPVSHPTTPEPIQSLPQRIKSQVIHSHTPTPSNSSNAMLDSPTDDQPSQMSRFSETSARRPNTLLSFDRPVSGISTTSTRSIQQRHQSLLRLNPVDVDLSSELRYLTLGGDDRLMTDPSQKRYSEDVADRNISKTTMSSCFESPILKPAQKVATQGDTPGSSAGVTGSNTRRGTDLNLYPLQTLEQSYRRIAAGPFCYGEYYQPRFEQQEAESQNPSIGGNDSKMGPAPSHVSPTQTTEFNISPTSPVSDQQQPNQSVSLAKSRSSLPGLWNGTEQSSAWALVDSSTTPSPRLSDDTRPTTLNDRSPPSPWRTSSQASQAARNSFSSPTSSYMGESMMKHRDSLHRSSLQPIDPSSVVDLSNTNDTDTSTRWAPAVTHETVYPELHNVREEQITREIHNHDIYHRILPIKEVEVLPARHFLRSPTGEEYEIPASSLPGRTGTNQTWQIVESIPSMHNLAPKPRTFTARTFNENEGDSKQYENEDGVPCKETTWVHPPMVEEGSKLSGQTQPLYIDDIDQLVQQKKRRMPGGWFDGAGDPPSS